VAAEGSTGDKSGSRSSSGALGEDDDGQFRFDAEPSKEA
jgi:hypothetical protein